MRIGELAKRSGLSRDTIRFYERRGLIGSEPEQGAANNYRAYPDSTLPTLEWIGEAQAAGLSLDDFQVLMQQLDQEIGNEDFDGLAFLDAKITEVSARIRQSQRFLKTLRQTRDALERSPG